MGTPFTIWHSDVVGISPTSAVELNSFGSCPSPTCGQILDILEAFFHPGKSSWIFLRELRVGAGHRDHSLQRLDAFALSCLPHLGMKRVCYEIKTSRADFLGEVRRPLKRRIGMRYSNEFFFVTPLGLLEMNEVPIDCGLIEIQRVSAEESRCTISVPAPWRDTPAPTWQFAAAMLRNQRRTWEERQPAFPKQQRLGFE